MAKKRTETATTSRLEKVYDQLATIDPDDLRDALLAITEGAPTHVSIHDVDDPGPELSVGEGGVVAREDLSELERIVGFNNQLPVHFLEEGVVVQRAVARVKLKVAHSGLPAGSGWGTGSLVSPSLLLTNNHVIPSKDFAKKVAAEFNYQFDHNGTALASDTFDLDPDSVFVTNASLDYTLVRVKSKRRFQLVNPVVGDEDGGRVVVGPIDRPFPTVLDLWRTPGSSWGWLRLPAGSVSYAVGQYLNVVGHPAGRRKEVALQDNSVTHVYTNVLRYTTDTEPGSSGSPVFTNAWDLVALHHAGGDQAPSGAWLNNEGIRIDKIVTHLKANATAAVKTELGI